MAPPHKPFQLLEINIISAQDLEPVSNKMRTYATAWVNAGRKLTSCVDTEGKQNPTWNDKFVFRVDDEFLRQDTSAVMIEINSEHWFRNKLVGTVRVLVGNLIPPPPRHGGRHQLGMRFVALQVRRPSGRPQGILNIGVALLDSSMRGMALYRQLSASAVGYRDLMADPPAHRPNDTNQKPSNGVKPILRRSRSERSERVTFGNSPTSSIVPVPPAKPAGKESSILSINDQYVDIKVLKQKGKASSVINGAELLQKSKLNKSKRSKASSVVSDSFLSNRDQSSIRKLDFKRETDQAKKIKLADEKSDPKANGAAAKIADPRQQKSPVPLQTVGKPVPKYNNYEYGLPKGPLGQGKYVMGAPVRGNSVLSDSEVGPSPSEVAAALAERRYPLEVDNQSSVLDGWSLNESVEGLRSKLDRWRTEIPPLYDRNFSNSTYRSSGQHVRRNPEPESGLFSCFGNIFGYECQCICGQPAGSRPPPRRTSRYRSPSVVTSAPSF